MFLSVIIPSYNEAQRIEKTLNAVDCYLSTQNYSYEILVVNDGSSDLTAQIVSEKMKSIKHLKLVENSENRGKGWAVCHGMLKATGEYRLFMDADNATTIDHIENFLPFFNKGYGVVIGSRAIHGAIILVPQSFLRSLLGRIGNLIIQIVALYGIHDTQCGFKMFTAETAKDVFSKLTIFRWGFDVEALTIARCLGYSIKELPVIWTNDARTHVHSNAYFQVFIDTVHIRWNLITKKYQTPTSASHIVDIK